MTEITIDRLMKKAENLQKANKKWHFHILIPNCMFNKRKDKYAFVLENETDSETYVVYLDKKYTKEGQKLVKMLHGKFILKEEELTSEKIDENMKAILKKAKEYNKKGIEWHHHMLFPNCIFNKHKNKWCIIFEDPLGNKELEHVSDKEPKEALRQIEILYYAQK